MGTILEIVKIVFGGIGKLLHFSRRPKFKIYFDPSKSYRTVPMADNDYQPGFFCHLMVENTGKEIAEGCRGRVIDIQQQQSDGTFQRHTGFVNPFFLKWSHEDYEQKAIEHDIPRKIDLCYGVSTIQDVLFFFTPNVPDGNQVTYPPGTYKVTVRVTSENTKQTDGTFLVNYPGQWNGITIEE